jgi:hypothetical protein
MNKVQVSLIEVHPVTRKELGEHEVVIDIDEYGARDLPDFFKDNLGDIRTWAAKAVASRFVDYDSFGSDSAYLDRLDQVGELLYLSDVSVPNAEVRPYDIEGIYPDDGGIWADMEHGSCLGEAQFRGLWTMSVNNGFDLDAAIKSGVSPDKAVSGLQTYMDDQELTGMCLPRGPRVEDAEALLSKLSEMARNGGEADLRQAVVEGAADFIGRLNEDIPDVIVELSVETEASPTSAL